MKKSRIQIIIYRKNKYKHRRQVNHDIKHAKKGKQNHQNSKEKLFKIQ